MAEGRLSRTIDELTHRSDLLYLLMDDLVELLEEPPEKNNTRWVVAALEKMLENLDTQARLEEEQGYLSDVLEQFPNWHPQVVHLQQEHRLLVRQLRETRDRTQREAGDAPLGQETRRQLKDWIETCRQHRKRENTLVQDAFNLEVGAGE